ncbi:hypothetical protein BRARA_C00519 [Brassica rapa]|uniref:DUF4283 domain-containing protein n=1 Tax=Brassica campestris TaxID=3711 RepID=A0A397ZT08_BRACM|nr:hypothetical protein BRARA_C00519 [Brassica rapa]
MAQRTSRGEKEKWMADPPMKSRRPPIKIPEGNNRALIEENRFTLIGRVTNPHIQKTRALVDFFLQHWRVQGNFTGRALGPSMFQFKFESEHDLDEVLSQAPFHFKRWMMILQRWEPIVSDFFPALIPFWITIHGLPLHYWTEEALESIGTELGPVDGFDVDQGRVRVLINGLKPLEMILDVSTPSGELKQVELEYEGLQKHCFVCHSLSHEKEDCPSLNLTPRNEWRPIVRESQIEPGSKTANPQVSKSVNSHTSHTPSPRPEREGDSRLKRVTPSTSHRPEEGSEPSHERRSALERLSLSHERIPLLQDGVANSESGRLQEVDIQYLEETAPRLQPVERSIPSSSRNPISQTPEHYDPSQDRSPIRTLSEDRLHVSLRLGPLRDTNIEEEEDNVLPRKESALKRLASTISRVDKGKGKMLPQTKKRVCRSPIQGASLKRRRVTRSQNSPRRKLLHDAIRSGATNSRGRELAQVLGIHGGPWSSSVISLVDHWGFQRLIR